MNQFRAVRASPEFARIRDLPRRDWREGADELAAEMSSLLSVPGGTMQLFPAQAVTLKEAYENQGAIVPLGVGKGKTLISLLLPRVIECQRPLLLLPAKHVTKTKRAILELGHHWALPRFLKIVSYEILGRVSGASVLDQYKPDLIIGDEAHKLKNPRAGVTIRVQRYVEEAREKERPLTCVWMSGTLIRKKLRDFAHLMQWAIPELSCVPWTWVELEDWSNALDVAQSRDATKRVDAGALLSLCKQSDFQETDSPMQAARQAFGRRLTETPGVISSPDSELGTSLTIDSIILQTAPVTEKAFEDLRTLWKLPNEQYLEDGPVVWAAARRLALDFYQIWDPLPPIEWRVKRKIWRDFVLDKIREGHGDTAHQVTLKFDAAEEVQDWLEIKKTFVVNSVPVWIGDNALQACLRWADKRTQGIIWVEHVAFGDRLSEMSGLPYFGPKGLDKKGRFIEDVSGPIIASSNACRDGFNLQYLHYENLETACPASGEAWEQKLGRTHRTGQTADTVTSTVLISCIEHIESFWDKAIVEAEFASPTMQSRAKLLYADIDVPDSRSSLSLDGPAWYR